MRSGEFLPRVPKPLRKVHTTPSSLRPGRQGAGRMACKCDWQTTCERLADDSLASDREWLAS
eukprot:114611-Alexandrium_andersonii.AAC.1